MVHSKIILFRVKKKKGGGSLPESSVGKESSCNARDLGLIPGSGRSVLSESGTIMI